MGIPAGLKFFRIDKLFMVFVLLVAQAEMQLLATVSDDVIARITRFHGEVTVLSQQSSQDSASQVLMGGERYFAAPARLGHELRAGDWVQTARSARARIIYQTGDQLTVAQATSYRLVEEGEEGEKRALIDLMFGRVRALIRLRAEQNQPELELRTRDMVMGVRGTDFFVSAGSPNVGSQLTVLRGELAVQDRQDPQRQVQVAAGYTLELVATPEQKELQPKRADQEQIAAISQLSRVEAPEPSSLASSVEADQIQQLENLARESLMADIAKHQPDLYEKIKAIPESQIEDSELIQSISTREVFEKAPSRKDSSGNIREFELDPYGDDVYKKYLRYRN